MNELTSIYETLKEVGLCATQRQFSEEWLGRSAHYMSQIGGDPRKASLTSLQLLVSRLELASLEAKSNESRATYRKIRSAFVEASTVLNGVFEIRYVIPEYRVTAL